MGACLFSRGGNMEYKDGRKYCVGCWYFFGYYEGSRCCNYIFVRGEKRPCPPGKDCTVKKKERRKTRKWC